MGSLKLSLVLLDHELVELPPCLRARREQPQNDVPQHEGAGPVKAGKEGFVGFAELGEGPEHLRDCFAPAARFQTLVVDTMTPQSLVMCAASSVSGTRFIPSSPSAAILRKAEVSGPSLLPSLFRRPGGHRPLRPSRHRLVVGGCLEHAPCRFLPRLKSVTCLLEFFDRLPWRGFGREQSVHIPWVHDLPFEVEVEISAGISCDLGEISIGEVLLT